MKIIITILVGLIVSTTTYCQSSTNTSIKYSDSTIYLLNTVELSGKLYAYVDKTSVDYASKYFLYFLPKDSLLFFNLHNIDLQKGFILVSAKKFENIVSKLQNHNPMLINLRKDEKLNSESITITDTKISKTGKVNYIDLKSKFFIFFLDVNIYKSLFWTHKKIQLPESGYIKLITPSYKDTQLNF
jgi:hypothetical protein